MPRQLPAASGRPRRSYDQYCATARALDAVGDRWTLLIARELLAGPRRYTDLHADLPGVSTDMLASRLKDMEREGIAERRRLPAPAAATVYALTDRGRALLPVLDALAAWGGPALTDPGPTDAVRAHWFALPLRRLLGALPTGGATGVVDVRVDEGEFHVRVGALPVDECHEPYGDGPAPGGADTRLALSTTVCAALARGDLALAEAVRRGEVRVDGTGELAVLLGDSTGPSGHRAG
ncbi:helix-turn-helix domain-containing protein [Streptomyces sp. NPDC049906]|uniref:winged helix-turn-helix transcriptional regulator n=1 Tax=Streptomyces sp. NPDC049906 TaxID=3155656 RepID=UPI00342E4B53